jgi:hypothetical protein
MVLETMEMEPAITLAVGLRSSQVLIQGRPTERI